MFHNVNYQYSKNHLLLYSRNFYILHLLRHIFLDIDKIVSLLPKLSQRDMRNFHLNHILVHLDNKFHYNSSPHNNHYFHTSSHSDCHNTYYCSYSIYFHNLNTHYCHRVFLSVLFTNSSTTGFSTRTSRNTRIINISHIFVIIEEHLIGICITNITPRIRSSIDCHNHGFFNHI